MSSNVEEARLLIVSGISFIVLGLIGSKVLGFSALTSFAFTIILFGIGMFFVKCLLDEDG